MRGQNRALLPQDQVLYENGPANGTTDAWTINFGFIVSDTITLTDPNNNNTVTGFDLYVWEFPGDTLTSVDWSITDSPNGGNIYGSGTVGGKNLIDTYISTNQFGYNVDEISVSGLNVTLTSATYWVNLFNAGVSSGDPVYWDENSGQGCQSTGCPSQAYQSATGTIPSESFDVVGNNNCYYNCQPPPPPCFQSEPPYFQIIHDFSWQEGLPQGVTIDQAGNVYGTTARGLVYKLAAKAGNWIFSPLYTLTDGGPSTPVTIGPEGSLYGAADGGTCGQVFRLRPPPTACLTALCSWSYDELYRFAQGDDGCFPNSPPVFDKAGNLYGMTYSGGANNYGTVYELTPSADGWSERVIYSLPKKYWGTFPYGLIMGTDGNLYGIATSGPGFSWIFQLAPSGNDWVEKDIYQYQGTSDLIDLAQDSAGNLYAKSGGSVFMLSPSDGGWIYQVIFTLQLDDQLYWKLDQDLSIDAADNLYVTAHNESGCRGSRCAASPDDTYMGVIFKRPPAGDFQVFGWIWGDFSSARGQLAADAGGNLYGTTWGCGKYGDGTVWRLTP
jgi:uncharacterized repeat protein (TIGR03803 family)